MKTPPSAVVTGATGFIGRSLAQRLTQDKWDVHLLVRQASIPSLNKQLGAGCTVHALDGTFQSVVEALRKAGPDMVFHLASLFLASHRPEDLNPLVESNIAFGLQLAEAMTLTGCKRLINTGTSWQHYENRAYSPVCLYAASKEAYEKLLQFYHESRGLSVVTLKLFDTYGPGDERRKLIRLLREAAASNQPLGMSPGRQMVDLVHVDDVAEAYLRTAELLFEAKEPLWRSFAVSSGSPMALQQVALVFERACGKNLPIIWGERPYREREVMEPWKDGERVPGWQPQIPLEEGLRRMLRHDSQADDNKGNK